jgi:hypothetical protein
LVEIPPSNPADGAVRFHGTQSSHHQTQSQGETLHAETLHDETLNCETLSYEALNDAMLNQYLMKLADQEIQRDLILL